MNTQNELKALVGRYAGRYVQDNMIVGLGTGSTVYYFVEELGRRIREEHLQIVAVTTSTQTQKQAESLGIPLKSIDDVPYIDVIVDGADEVNPAFNGIKGGGGALLFEKIVAKQAKTVIWVVDASKQVQTLGAFPLPVEVVRYGHSHVFRVLKEKGYAPVLRQRDGKPYVTDDGNYILDLHLDKITDEYALAKELDQLTGVVEHGLFLDLAQLVLVGTTNGVEVIEHV